MRNLFLIFILSNFLISCSALNETTDKEVQEVTDLQTANKLNGTYSLFRNGADNYIYSLDDVLKFTTDFDNEIRVDSTHFVRITMLDERTLKADLYSNDLLLETSIVKGKMKKDYFIINGGFEIPAFYLLFNAFRTSSSRVALLPNGNLVADYEYGGCGLLVLFPIMCASNEVYDLTFEKIKPAGNNI